MPYNSLTVDSFGRPKNAFPFADGGSTDAQGITVQGSTSVGSIQVYDSFYVANSISSVNLDAQTILIGSNSILTRSILTSTVGSLGQTYTSSLLIPVQSLSTFILRNEIFSTVAGLGPTYLSTASLTSTIAGLGTYGYLSTTQLTSTVTGLSNTYVLSSNLQSTIAGLGSFGYVSTSDFLSTTAPFAGGYIRPSSYASTFAGMGTIYVSTSRLISTIAGLGSLGYVSAAQLFSTTAGFDVTGPITNTTPLYTSTVAGLGSSKYVSTSGITSTVSGISASNGGILQSTIAGLGTAGYLSVSQLTSSVQGLSNTYILGPSIRSSVAGLFAGPYSQTFSSTVQGLGNSYVSTLNPMVTSVSSNRGTELVSTTLGLAQTYISSPSIFSTVTGLSNIYTTPSNLISTVAGVGSLSRSNMVSTVVGLGSLQPNGYVSSTQLFSTVSNVNLLDSNLFAQLMPTLGSLPYSYVSTVSLVSTVQGLSNTYIVSPNLISTVSVVGGVNTSNLVSTVGGMGSLQPDSYVSSTQLFSTVSNVSQSNLALFSQVTTGLASSLSYISTPSLVSTVRGLSNIYITSSNLISTVENTGSSGRATIVSTVVGLGSLLPNGYVSSTQLFSTVLNVNTSNSNLFASLFPTVLNAPYTYLTTGVVSTVTGLSNTYIISPNLTSTIASVTLSNRAYLVSQVNTLPATYTQSNQLFTAVANVNSSNTTLFAQTMPNIASPPFNYISTPSLVSTAVGLSNAFVPPTNITTEVTNLSNSFVATTVTTIANLAGVGTNPLISTPHLVSTVSNVNLATSNRFVQAIPHLGSPPYSYISSASLISTVAGANNANFPFSNLPPVVASLSSNLASTVVGMGRFQPNSYVSSTQLFSTVSNVILSESIPFTQFYNGLSNSYTTRPEMVSTVVGLGSTYISSLTLVATVSNYNASTKYTEPQLISSSKELGTKGYISSASLTSTLRGLGGYGYVSTASLITTVTGLSNAYVFSNTIPTTNATIQANLSNYLSPIIPSTVAGLGSLATPGGYGYISASVAYMGFPTYVSITGYISSLYGLENVILRSTTIGVTSALGSPPAITRSNLSIPVQTNSVLFTYNNGVVTPSPNVSVRFDGIQMSNIYSKCNITSDNFRATTYEADGTMLTNGSDKRLKYDITPLTGALSTISHLEGVYYRMIGAPERQLLGFIAQDVEPVYPELVFTNETKSIKYDSIGVILLEAIKELNLQCDELLALANNNSLV